MTTLRYLLGAALIAGLAASAAAEPFTMKITHPTLRSPLDFWAEQVKAGVEGRSQGRVKGEIYPGSKLGDTNRMIEGVQLGTIEIAEVAPDSLTGVDERYGIFAAPGVFSDIRHGTRTLADPQFKEIFWKLGEPKGIRTMGATCEAPTDTTMVNPVTKIADFGGKKIRVLGSRFEREALASIGAAGVPMPNTEVVPALQARSIDGNRSGITIFVPFKYETVAKHLFKEKEAIICIVKIVSKAWLDKLPADLPPIIMEEGLKADVAMQPVTAQFLDNMFKAWAAAGGTTTELAAAEQAELHKRYVASAELVVKDNPRLKEMYEQLKAAAARTRQ